MRNGVTKVTMVMIIPTTQATSINKETNKRKENYRTADIFVLSKTTDKIHIDASKRIYNFVVFSVKYINSMLQLNLCLYVCLYLCQIFTTRELRQNIWLAPAVIFKRNFGRIKRPVNAY